MTGPRCASTNTNIIDVIAKQGSPLSPWQRFLDRKDPTKEMALKVRRAEGQSSPRRHHLSPPLSYRLWPADVANGRAGPCQSKSHFCPLRLPLPVLTERGSEAEGGGEAKSRQRQFFYFFFSTWLFVNFCALVKTRDSGPYLGWGVSVGKVM